MNVTTECHERPATLIIDGPAPDSPAGIAYRAADLLNERAEKLAKTTPWVVQPDGPNGIEVESEDHSVLIAKVGAYGNSTDLPEAEFIASLDPDVAKAIALAWSHQADDMNDYYGHFHPVPIGWHVVDEYGQARPDWTATVHAALKYLREPGPAVAS